MRKIAIIGFGCAGFSAARAMRQTNSDISIHIYSSTAEGPYNPMLTTYYISGKISESAMFPLGSAESIAAELGAEVFSDSAVTQLCAAERKIVLANGNTKQYDDIIIATGASAVIPPIKDLPDSGIYTMRTASDARTLLAALESGVKSALVVGAQMVGIKVVELLLARGIKTCLADMEERMFPASAYDTTAEKIASRLKNAGCELRLGAAVTGVTGQEGALHAYFADGESIDCDIVVFCSGIRPNISFVNRDEIDVGLGIKVGPDMRTNVPNVYAAGDCCECTDVLTGKSSYIGLWANSAMQGRVAGSNAAGAALKYQGNLIHNITHYMDTDFISAGYVKSLGQRIYWEKPDGSWSIEATISGGRMLALNILDNAGISGSVKNALLHLATHPEAGLSDSAKLILSRSGIPAGIIKSLGGEDT